MTAPQAHPRQSKQLDAGMFQAEISSFALRLAAEGKAAKTIRTYTEAVQWYAAAGLQDGRGNWEQVTSRDIQRWMAWLLGRYSTAYASNQYRALQQFFKWLAAEDELPDPLAGLAPPRVADKLVPVFAPAEVARLERACAGRSFAHRHDTAIIAVLTATGIRLSELAGLRCGDLDLWQREITVRGKGGKDRIVRIGHQAARRLDRYLRARARHAHARRPQLWLGAGNREPLTGAGIYQMITRRGRQAGVDAYPHRFRHHFSHTWPDRGGPEGDLMKLNGWSSPQMLRRYGASARSARARRTYDRIMTDTYHRRLGRYPGRPREAPTAHEASGQQNLGQDLPDRPSRTPRQPLGPSCESVPRARAGSPWTADCVSPRKPPATPQKSHKSAFRAAS